MRRTVLLALSLLVVAACTDDRVTLAYGLDPGRRLEYRLELRAEVEQTLQGQTRAQDLAASFRATQEILEPREGGGARARITMEPLSLLVEGRPVEIGPVQEFEVELGPDGRLVAIGEPTEEPQRELVPVGIERLLPRLRPVLPGTEVAAGDAWSSDTEYADAGGSFSVSTRSRLARLGLLEGKAAALVHTSYESPVDRRETFANAVARLHGSDVGAQQAWFALDGFLLRASGDSVGNYLVTFTPTDGQALGVTPVQGTLAVHLHTEMEVVGSS